MTPRPQAGNPKPRLFRVPEAEAIINRLTEGQIEDLASLLLAFEIDGVIATNTPLNREAVHDLKHGAETGGLSGRPLRQRATQVLYHRRPVSTIKSL